jgi:2-polyprenyl-3-methyl-5-hydroxy-6-metoxy-1,4-benzoquinol methylase
MPSIDAQRSFWDSWNARFREGDALDAFMERQREQAVGVAHALRLHDARILDVGCGTGWLANSLREFGSVSGIDLSPLAIDAGRRAYPQLRLLCGDFANGADVGTGYDLVVTADVIGNVPDHARFVGRCAELVQPRGHLLLMAQNPFVWNRSSGLKPRADGQIRNWVDMRTIRALLAPFFEIRGAWRIAPGGDRGVLWFVGNRYVRGAARRIVGAGRWTRFLERMGIGRELVVLAQRK